jgi:hypothetical protein
VPDTVRVVGSWAFANSSSPGSVKGLSDFAYGPAAARVIDSLDSAPAPIELSHLLAPAKGRAHAIMDALRAAGLDDAGASAIADLVQQQLASPDDPDPVTVQTAARERLRSLIGDDRLNAAAQEFEAAHPEVPGLFDLGDVTDDAARAAGYDCLVGPRG